LVSVVSVIAVLRLQAIYVQTIPKCINEKLRSSYENTPMDYHKSYRRLAKTTKYTYKYSVKNIMTYIPKYK